MEHDSQPEGYCVHVWIREIHPMLWRRFLVRSDSTLADLHVLLQIAFDWTDLHLHRFRIRKKDYAVPRLGGLGCHDARKIKLGDLHFRINERFLYEYDFGDLWQHQVRIEKRLEVEASRSGDDRVRTGLGPSQYQLCGMGRRTAGRFAEWSVFRSVQLLQLCRDATPIPPLNTPLEVQKV
jgi:hypothetical protein